MEPLSAIRGYLEQRFAKATYTVRKDHSKREDTEHRNHARGTYSPHGAYSREGAIHIGMRITRQVNESKA